MFHMKLFSMLLIKATHVVYIKGCILVNFLKIVLCIIYYYHSLYQSIGEVETHCLMHSILFILLCIHFFSSGAKDCCL